MHTNTKCECRKMPHQEFGVFAQALRIIVLAAVVGGLVFAIPANAATSNTSQAQQNMTTQAKQKYWREHKMDRSPQAMAQRVEERIKTLHEKLGIMSEQEGMWNDVAQTMRDNEATIATLVEERHKNAKDMNAIDDLKSYEEITRAHADGIKRLISSFDALYDDMSDDQKKAADEAFGRFEGRRGNISSGRNK
jgi:cell division protein FtsN